MSDPLLVDVAALSPLLVLSGAGIGVLLMSALWKRGSGEAALVGLSLAAFGLAAVGAVMMWHLDLRPLFGGQMRRDRFSLFFQVVFCAGGAITVLQSMDYAERMGIALGEMLGLVLTAAAGMMLMAGGTDLLTIFLGLEVTSVSVYILSGATRWDLRSNEAALKYFILGAFSSGILVYGMALLFGAAGTLALAGIAQAAAGPAGASPVFAIGAAMVLAAFLFKVAAVPFHMWTPDVYDGAPTPVAGFMSTGVKAAGFAVLVRLGATAFAGAEAAIGALWVVAVLSMAVGNLAALRQRNIKRMLAYSSIAHAGYLLVGLVSMLRRGGDGPAGAAILFYLGAYTFMNLGAFGVVAWFGRKGREQIRLEEYAGAGFRHPGMALALALFLLALAGIPPTAGFTGKWFLFGGAVDAGFLDLALVGVLTSLVSVYYYVRVIVVMYMRPQERDLVPADAPAPLLAVLLSAYGVLHLGLMPAKAWAIVGSCMASLLS